MRADLVVGPEHERVARLQRRAPEVGVSCTATFTPR
jgi:hypothetical protein